MNRLATIAVILLITVVSCEPTSTPQPQIALATATLQMTTATATMTVTPTNMLTPTVTPSPTTPTPTVTIPPSPTSKPTEAVTVAPTEVKPLNLNIYRKFELQGLPLKWGTDIGGGFEVRVPTGGYINDKSTLAIEPDRTGKLGDLVLRARISGPPTMPDGKLRAYVELFAKEHLEGPFGFEFSFVITKHDIGMESITSFSTLANDGKEYMVAGVHLVKDAGGYFFRPYTIDKNDKSTFVTKWRKVPYKIGDKGVSRYDAFRTEKGKSMAIFFLNNQYIGEGELRDDAQLIIGRVRGGGGYGDQTTGEVDISSNSWIL